MADLVHRTGVVCRVADDPWMVAEHHCIRDQVFVREQGLFHDSDRDGHDDEPATIKVLGLADGGDAAVLVDLNADAITGL